MSVDTTASKSNHRHARASDVAKALSHPMRLRILHKLNQRVASPKVIADELGESLAVVSYHVKILAQLDCIELVETVQKRGALEHFYRPLRRAELSSAEWAQLPASARESLSGVTLREVIKEASASIDSGAFDRDTDRHLSLTTLELDDAGWTELNEALDELYGRALQLQARALAGSSETRRSALALAHFERAPGAADEPAT
jgi:DNA-binding transcriptional ArsR family regulator